VNRAEGGILWVEWTNDKPSSPLTVQHIAGGSAAVYRRACIYNLQLKGHAEGAAIVFDRAFKPTQQFADALPALTVSRPEHLNLRPLTIHVQRIRADFDLGWNMSVAKPVLGYDLHIFFLKLQHVVLRG